MEPRHRSRTISSNSLACTSIAGLKKAAEMISPRNSPRGSAITSPRGSSIISPRVSSAAATTFSSSARTSSLGSCAEAAADNNLAGIIPNYKASTRPLVLHQGEKFGDFTVRRACTVRDLLVDDAISNWAKLEVSLRPQDIPSLPDNIEQILNSPCPFTRGQKLKDTHIPCLIPQGATLDHFCGEFSGCHPMIRSNQNGKKSATSYWILLSKSLLEGSQTLSFGAQVALLMEKTYGTSPYLAPMLIEAVAAALMHEARTNEKLSMFTYPAYTACQEVIDGNRVIIGDYGMRGLSVGFQTYDHQIVGLSPLRLL